MKREMTGAEMVVQALKDQGVDTVFGYPGGAVLPIYDAIFQQNDIRHILVRHEQAAAHAAEGYARSTGRPGVVLVTSGPGATNAVTGMTDALMDSIPIVVLTGQVPTFMIGNDAFQEADTVGITRPCTKHNWLVKDTAKLAETIHQAFHVATHGRPGPVLVDIPKDVQFATAAYTTPEEARVKHYQPRTKGDEDAILAAVEALEKAERPVIYSGGGVINSGLEASRLLRELADATGFPLTSTLMGLGAYPATGKAWIGMLGMHGTYEANWAMHDCDFMLCIGARFDDRITGRTDAFSPGLVQGPHRHRPLVDQQEHPRPRPHRRRRRLGPRRHARPLAGPRLEDRFNRGRQVVEADRALARPQLPRLPQLRQGHQAAVRPAAPRGPDQAPRPLHLHRGRPAPDVGRAVHGLQRAPPLDDLRRPRHHGLRPPRLDRRADRPPRRPRHQRRRRGVAG